MEQDTVQKDNQITAEVPVELLFCGLDIFATREYVQFENLTRDWVEHHFQYTEISIARLTPHIHLFEFFMGNKNTTPSEYQEWYSKLFTTRKITAPYSDSEILMKRYQEYILMKNALEEKNDFFKNNPPIALYNNGVFYLEDGHHRSVFQMCSGKRRIFVRMNTEDYIAWLNDENKRIVKEIIQAQGRKLFYTPILHPAFYNIQILRDTEYPTRLELILRYLGQINLRGMKIVDIGCNIGYYARHFTREGAIVIGIEPDPYQYVLLEAVNKLENVSFEVIKERFEACSLPTCNIGILLTVFYHIMEDVKIRDEFLQQVNQCITEMLFWESGDEIEIEKKMILESTHFNNYERLGSTFGTGKVRELGVFIRRM